MEQVINEPKQDRSIIGALLSSNFPTLIQLAVVLSVGLGTSIGLTNFFYFRDHLTLINFLTFLLTTSIIFSYSFFRKNKKLSADFSNPESGTKTFIVILQILQLIFFLFFLVSTLLIFSKVGSLIVLGLIQGLSYPLLLIIVGMIIFIWFQDHVEKQKYFKQEELIPNLNLSLRRQGIIKDKTEIIFLQDLPNANKLFKITEGDNGSYYIISSFDANLILGRLTSDEYMSLTLKK